MKINSKYPCNNIYIPEFKEASEKLEFCNVVSMAIKIPGNNSYHIPENYGIVWPLINAIENLYGNKFSNMYAYMTIKKMFIASDTFPNRPGWHIDGFLSDQSNFIICDSIPTEILCIDCDLTEDHSISLGEMDNLSGGKILDLPLYSLIELDRECIHSPSRNNDHFPVLRTFVKITYSEELFNGIGNAWNYLLPEIVPSKSRDLSRNHGVK